MPALRVVHQPRPANISVLGVGFSLLHSVEASVLRKGHGWSGQLLLLVLELFPQLLLLNNPVFRYLLLIPLPSPQLHTYHYS